MADKLCNAPNPGLDGGSCNHPGYGPDRCAGRHSWEPTPTDEAVLPPRVVTAIKGKPAAGAAVEAPEGRTDGKYQDQRGRWHNADGSFCAAPT